MELPDHVSAMGADRKRAVIDIGSNTVRLVIYGGPPRAPSVLHNEKVNARLGRGVVENGLLADNAMAMALAALKRYRALLTALNVRDVQTVATAAVRDSANGAQFLRMVDKLGLSPVLLSGQEEAEIGALGVLSAFPGATGIVADLGGGSLELTEIDGHGASHGASLPIGSLRLPSLRSQGQPKFARMVHREIERAQWNGTGNRVLYLVGGSYRALARVAIHKAGWPVDDPHGLSLPVDRALELCRSVSRGKLPSDVPTLSASRLAAMPDVAALLSRLIKELDPSSIVFSAWGLREGLLFRSQPIALRQGNPLVAGVAEFATAMGVSTSDATMMAGWTVSANPADGDGLEAVRLAAVMLALACQRIEPNHRYDTAMDWILRKRWIGLDDKGRGMVARALAANCGREGPTATLARLASREQIAEGQAWGMAIRLCRRLAAMSTRVMANSSLSLHDRKLVLTVREPWHALCGDAVEKDLRNLAQHLGLQPSLNLVRTGGRRL